MLRRTIWPWLFFLFLCFAGSPVWAIDFSSWSDLQRWRNPQDWPFIPIPEIATDPNGDTTFGLLPVWLVTDSQKQIRQMIAPDLTYNPTLGWGGTMRWFSYPSEDTLWYLVASGAEKIDRDIDLLYSTGRTRQNWWSFDGRVRYERDPTDRFFGIGNNTGEAKETNFTTEQFFAEARFGLNFSPQLQAALELRPRYVAIQPGAFSTFPFVRSVFPGLPGLHSEHEFFTRLLLAYDTRDSITIPRQGSLLNAFAGGTDKSVLSSVSYSIFGLEGRHYIPLSPRMTIAAHVALRYMPVGRNAPFWALSRLGGDRSDIGGRQPLRGFGDSRFVDRNQFVTNVEWRTQVFSLEVFQTRLALELAPFLELGRVFHSPRANPLSALHPVGGVGFRGLAAPFVVGYVDVGYGGEGMAIFSGIDYPF